MRMMGKDEGVTNGVGVVGSFILEEGSCLLNSLQFFFLLLKLLRGTVFRRLMNHFILPMLSLWLTTLPLTVPLP